MVDTYERLIKKEVRGRLLLCKILLISAYSIWAVAGILFVMLKAQMNIYLLALVILLDLLFIAITWKRTYIEYEYTLTKDCFELAKIYGKAQRKELLSADLCRAVTVAPYCEKYTDAAKISKADKVIRAISSKSADDIWFVVFEDDSEGRTLVIFEADDSSLRLLRQACPRAVANEKLTARSDNKKQV